MEDVAENPPFRENFTARRTRETLLTDFERQHFHPANVAPEDTLMPASEIFDALLADGFQPEHVRCLQRKPTGEVFLTFRNQGLRDTFLQKSCYLKTLWSSSCPQHS